MEDIYLKNPKTGEVQSPHTVAQNVHWDNNKMLPQKINEIESKAGLTMNLLWENASPTNNYSNNVTATLADTSSYKYFILFSNASSGSSYVVAHILMNTSEKQRCVYSDTSSRQDIVINATSINFGTAIYSSNSTTSRFIPYKLYGIK